MTFSSQNNLYILYSSKTELLERVSSALWVNLRTLISSQRLWYLLPTVMLYYIYNIYIYSGCCERKEILNKPRTHSGSGWSLMFFLQQSQFYNFWHHFLMRPKLGPGTLRFPLYMFFFSKSRLLFYDASFFLILWSFQPSWLKVYLNYYDEIIFISCSAENQCRHQISVKTQPACVFYNLFRSRKQPEQMRPVVTF